jgi:hypothetical protein
MAEVLAEDVVWIADGFEIVKEWNINGEVVKLGVKTI